MKKLLVLLIVVFNFLNANQVVNIAYKPLNENTALDARITQSLLENASKDGKNFKFNDSVSSELWNSIKSIFSNAPVQQQLSICQDLYRFEYDGERKLIGSPKLVETEKTLIDFDAHTGVFTCLYKDMENKDSDLAHTFTYSLSGYLDLLNYFSGDGDMDFLPSVVPFNFFNGKYSPTNYKVLFSQNFYKYRTKSEVIKSLERIGGAFNTIEDRDKNNEDASNFDISITQGQSARVRESTIYGRAYQLGLAFANPNVESNFTVSQFLSGLITLNDSVVEGVSSNGDIIINKDIQSKMTILSEKSTKTLNVAVPFTKENIAFSFVDYFDKKIFGLYYNFMNIGWTTVFNYGGLLIIAMVFLYSGGIVGYKFFMFRINSNNEGKEWDFPFANRIVAIIVMLVLSFLHYPVGEKEVISVDNGKIDIQMETSGAKVAIGFLANIGATIADVASGAGITVYMDYLLKATNMQGYEDVVKSVQSQQRPIIEFAISQSFFNTACSNGQHKKQYNSLGSFASAKGHLDNLWSIEKWDINNQFFGGTGGVISPLLCQKIEKNMKIDESVLNGMKSANDKMLSNLGSTGKIFNNGADHRNMADVYVDMQLIATRDLGWIMSATLPISHIYMLNAGTINNTFDGLNRSTNGETTTIMLKSMVKAESQADNASSETMQYIEDSDSDSLGSGVFRWATNDMIGRQVYNMLPMFSELRGTIQVLTNGAIDSVIEIAGLIIPAGKVFSAVNSLKSKITSKAKKNDLKNGMNEKDANELAKQRADSVVSGVQAYAVYLISYYIAIYLYKILLGAIFASVVTLLAILKIGLYFWDCFIHIFVSPLLVLWKMTIQDRTEKVNAWIVDGFILYVIKPTILVFSFFMFIISFEILQGLYALMFDLAFTVLKLNHTIFEEGSIMLSVIVEGAMRGFSDVFIYFIGMVLAYFTILKGDTMILDKFKYKDDTDTGVVNQLGERIQALGGARI